MFSPLVSSQWVPSRVDAVGAGETLVIVDPTLTANRSVSLLRLDDGPAVLSLSPDRAGALGLSDGERVDSADLGERLARESVTMHDPDLLFYLPVEAQVALRDEPWPGGTRRLTGEDEAAFAAFTAEAPEDDLDEAYVELDHWLVVGTFVDDRLVCATSAYPWRGTQLADVGVLTLPEFRGRGLGRVTVRAICAAALERGHEPQYRCQLENTASAALARAAGFARFGQWEVVDAGE